MGREDDQQLSFALDPKVEANRSGTDGATERSRKKALGAFYTPGAMATGMVDWAIRHPSDSVLDPSFGGLVFLRAAHRRLAELGASSPVPTKQIFGVDLDDRAHASVAESLLIREPATLVKADFFDLRAGRDLPLVDAVIGNPPYVRYQLHNVAGGRARQVAANAGIRFSQMASSWAPFLLHATAFVKDGGRLALVLPAELMHAQYADEVLSWVQKRFARTAIVIFERRVFPGALEEVVLLFAEGKGERSRGLSLLSFDDLAGFDLEQLQQRLSNPGVGVSGRDKLLSQLLSQETRELYGRLRGDSRVVQLGDMASVGVGALTGANDYFLLRDGEHPEIAPELLRPIVSKAIQLPGARFASDDFDRLSGRGARCLLFASGGVPNAASLASAAKYLARGTEARIHERYKCRVRQPWHAVPVPKHGEPDLFLTYCSAEAPRLVVNEARVLHTNTVHGVTLKGRSVSASALAASFYNSLTLLSAELVGRSYGGGVLKLEPTEAERLLVPPVPEASARLLERVDASLRAKRLEEAVTLVDEILLAQGLGLDEEAIANLRQGAERLRARRRARNKSPKLRT